MMIMLIIRFLMNSFCFFFDPVFSLLFSSEKTFISILFSLHDMDKFVTFTRHIFYLNMGDKSELGGGMRGA